MTVTNASNKAGPYLTNGVVTDFSFPSKVLKATDLMVYRTDLITGQEALLTSGYTVALINGGVDGATVTIAPALVTGYKVTLAREVNYLQDDYDPSPNSTYYANVLEDAMDKRVMQIQQVKEQVDRAVKFPITAEGVTSELPVPRAGFVLGSTDGVAYENLQLVDTDQAVAGNWTVDRFQDGAGFTAGASTSVTLSKTPASSQSILVTMNGVLQHLTTFTVIGTTLTFSSVIPAGVTEIEVRIPTMLVVGIPSDGSVTEDKIAESAVTLAKMASLADGLLLGRSAGSAGAPHGITAGAGLTLSAGVLSTSLAWWGRITNATSVAITGAATATIDRMHVVSGTSADYTIALPSVSANAGKVIGFTVKGWAAASKQFKLDAGGTTKIADRTRYLVLLHSNAVLLYSDGTDWIPLLLNLDTPWVDGGVNIITGATSNPTKGTVVRDKVWWRRQGDSISARIEYGQSAAGSGGSGRYLFAIPFGVSIDTNKTYFTTIASGLGAACSYIGGAYAVGIVIPDDATKVILLVGNTGNNPSNVSSTWGPMTSTTAQYLASYTVPVVDW